MEKVNVLGVQINKITMDEAVKYADGFFDGKPHMVFTPNPEIILETQKDAKLRDLMNRADLLLPDGIGVVIASKILGTPLPERVPGYDFVCRLLQTGRSFYFFGGKPGVAERAANRLCAEGVRVVGFHDGYFQDDREIIADIIEKKPDVLVVCLGAPRQEQWIAAHLEQLGVPLSIGAGGSVDVLAGEVERAPEIYQKLCIEWLYRALKEPKKRLPRIMKLPGFLIKVLFAGRSYQ